MKHREIESLVSRSHFPILKKKSYLNSAALGLVPTPVIDKMHYISSEIGNKGAAGFFEYVERIKYGTYSSGARLLGGTEKNIIVTSGISVMMSQLAYCFRFVKGQNVVMTDVDIPAVTYPWLRLAEETGLETRFAKVYDCPETLCEEKLENLIDEKTAAVCVSHVQWCTGHMMDLKRLADAAHSVGALLIVDAMHTAGVMPLDAKRDGVDIMVTGSYKWLCGFSGVAVCYMRPELIEQLKPVLVGANTPDPKPPYTEMSADHLDLPDTVRKFDYGSSAHIVQYIFTDTVNYLYDIGLENIYEHNMALFDQLADGLRTLGAFIITPLEKGRHAAVLTARFEGIDGLCMAEELSARNVEVIARLGGIRFSPHFFNSASDIDNALNATEDILKRLKSHGFRN